MRIVNVKKLDTKSKKYLYAVKFNNDDAKVIKHFDAFAGLLARLRSKKFDISTGEWIITQNGYNAFELLDKELFEKAPATFEAPKLYYENAEEKIVVDYENVGEDLKLPPYEYQKQLIKFCLDTENALIVAPCGSGKTIVGLDIYIEALKKNLISGSGMIVCKASLKTQWFMETKKFTNLRARIIQTKSTIKSEEEFQSQFRDVDLMILNYETLRDGDVRNALQKNKPQYIFADECQYIKNSTALRARALYEFNDAKIKVGATATPVQRDPRDIFGLFQFINPEIFPTIQDFNVKFVNFIGRGIVSGFKNEDILNKKISPYMIVKSKEEISKQLPKLIVSQRFCELEPKQLEMTDQILSELAELSSKKLKLEKTLTEDELRHNDEYIRIDAEVMARQNFAQEIADSEELLKISKSDMAKKYLTRSKKDNKLEMLMNLIEEIVESGEKLTVFSRFAKMQDIIISKINSLAKTNPTFRFKIARVYGSMTSQNRYDEVYTKFQDDDDYKILLMSDAGAEGFNLSKCKYLCEYEPAMSYAIQTQRHGRIERADSIFDNVFVYQFIANGSWDEIAQKIVSKKEIYDSLIIKGTKKN